MYKEKFANSLSTVIGESINEKDILNMIEKPKNQELGDFAFPCFPLAKTMKKSPQAIASHIAGQINDPLFEKVEAAGGYVNVFLNKQLVMTETIQEVLRKENAFGNQTFGEGQTITIDLSSPNIAKPFSMGHLRSTVIGNAISNISKKCGYQVVGINHLGDWGTQFGKLMVAYKKWGDEETVKANPIKELTKLYVRFHEEMELNPSLADEGREWFKKLENKDEEATALWKWFREESLKEFSKTYDLLGISFDSYNGEAFYNDKMEPIVEELMAKNLLEESDGALVVRLEEENLPPCLIKKSDGTTLYATRDLAAAIYRKNHYQFAKSLYVVGREQSLHFAQLKAVLQKMGYEWAKNIEHIPFGMILKNGKKMSTRKGKIVLLDEVLKEAIRLAEKNIEEKNPSLANKETTAHQVGVGAVIFHDLKNERINDVEFSLEHMLKFEGETGPYLQYTHARACTLLKKGEFSKPETGLTIQDEAGWPIVTLIREFPDVIQKAFEQFNPSLIAKHLINLAQSFNKYYGTVRILENNSLKEERLALVYATTVVLQEGLRLLGINAPEEM
ncbi:arginine--tRNA ligase [Fictibacillus gelatini]|uniref:arginine--tRNA ligase n=1 Tax=Fictibacillus gelatini TaxID=225985 RepID=UPI000409298D|nr:arginine--tRNA ligase [Fictibacillus gelatini]